MSTFQAISDYKYDAKQLLGLRLRQYSQIPKDESGPNPRIGFLAEEAKVSSPDLVRYSPVDGTPLNVDYSRVVAFLVEEIRALRERVATLESRAGIL